MPGHRSVRERLRHRVFSVSALLAFAVVITLTIPLWLPTVVLVDVVRLRLRLPLARLLMFGVCWAWIEVIGVARSFGGVVSTSAKPLPPVRFVVRRVPRREVPVGDAFLPWIDDQWLRMDAEVDAALTGTS